MLLKKAGLRKVGSWIRRLYRRLKLGCRRGLTHALCGLVNKQRKQRGQSVPACQGRWMSSGTTMGGGRGGEGERLVARRAARVGRQHGVGSVHLYNTRNIWSLLIGRSAVALQLRGRSSSGVHLSARSLSPSLSGRLLSDVAVSAATRPL